ncbi:TetR/AcrR family transcriptional regulator [Streptomyces sp. NPDC086080]|uniref:TetR/AcrR family transcriptional regulator n=1 Tax=Streptomyces sp. NPDC086080 TaxID=3365748 RepID=UPI0037D5848C
MRPDKRNGTRDAILDSALRLFAEQGYDAVRVQDLARAAGVSRATFYNHFSEREEVLGALFQRLLVREEAEPQVADDMPPLQRIDVVVKDAVRRMVEQEDLARFVYSLPVRHESLLRPDAPSTPAVFVRIHRLLEAAAARGELRDDVPIDLVCAHVHSALETGMRAWAEGRTDDPAGRVGTLVTLALYGIVAPAGTRPPAPRRGRG